MSALKLLWLGSYQDEASSKVPTCLICAGEHPTADTPSSPEPEEDGFPQEGEIRWGPISVFAPLVQFHKLDLHVGEGRLRPFVVTQSDESDRKCVVSLCATFTGYNGEPGLASMPEAAKLFCLQIAQRLPLNVRAGAGSPTASQYLDDLHNSHFHTRRDWMGTRRQYAIVLPYVLDCPKEGSYSVFRQGAHVTVEEDELDRLETISNNLRNAWRKVEEDDLKTATGLVAKLRRYTRAQLRVYTPRATSNAPQVATVPADSRQSNQGQQPRRHIDDGHLPRNSTNTPIANAQHIPAANMLPRTPSTSHVIPADTTYTPPIPTRPPQDHQPNGSAPAMTPQGAWKKPLVVTPSPPIKRPAQAAPPAIQKEPALPNGANGMKQRTDSEDEKPSPDDVSLGDWIKAKIRRPWKNNRADGESQASGGKKHRSTARKATRRV